MVQTGTFETLRDVMTGLDNKIRAKRERPTSKGSGNSNTSKPEDIVSSLCSNILRDINASVGDLLDLYPDSRLLLGTRYYFYLLSLMLVVKSPGK
jgi:hypothetical protein